MVKRHYCNFGLELICLLIQKLTLIQTEMLRKMNLHFHLYLIYIQFVSADRMHHLNQFSIMLICCRPLLNKHDYHLAIKYQKSNRNERHNLPTLAPSMVNCTQLRRLHAQLQWPIMYEMDLLKQNVYHNGFVYLYFF